MTPLEKQQNFHKELKALLRKYDAEILIETKHKGYILEERIIVEFGFDESLFNENGTGITPELDLGNWEDGTE